MNEGTKSNPYDPIMIALGDHRFELRLTVATMRTLRKLAPPIDITRLVDPDHPSGGLWAQMRDDPSIVVDIAYHAIQGQENAESDPVAFARLIDGDKLHELTTAVLRAIVSFTPSPRNREALTKIIEEVEMVESQLVDEAIAKLESGEVAKAIREAIDQETSTDTSSTCKVSSGSTRAGTRSES